MQEKHTTSGVDEAKAALSDLAGLGVESVKSARQWLHQRRHYMHRKNHNDHAASRRGLGPRSYTRSDERIEDALNEQLAMDDDVDARDIQVTVSEGVVVLAGEVDDRWQKYRADEIADCCYGVKQVENRIRVRGTADSNSGNDAGPPYDRGA